MPEAINRIATRQLTELLVERDVILGIGEVWTSPEFMVAGFFSINWIGTSNRRFELQVYEACKPTCEGGVFVATEFFTAVTVAGTDELCERTFPCARFMRFTLTNVSGATMTFLDFCALGLPEP